MDLKAMQDHVLRAAQDRYVKALEKQAAEAVRDKEYLDKTVQRSIDRDNQEDQRREELRKKNAHLLREQIEDNKVRAAQRRKDFIESASEHNFPLFTETLISQDEVDDYQKWVKRTWRDELDQQRVVQGTLRNLVIKRDKDYAAARLAESVQKMTVDRGLDRQRRIHERNELRTSWERDIKLNTIKKSILSGKHQPEHRKS